jgi:Subtilase family
MCRQRPRACPRREPHRRVRPLRPGRADHPSDSWLNVSQQFNIARSLTIAAVAGMSLIAAAQGQPPRRSVLVNNHEAVAGEVLVKFLRQPGTEERLQLERQIDADESEAFGVGFRRMHSRRLGVLALIASLRAHPVVAYVEPNYLWHATVSPNDPQFPNLWALRNVGQNIGGSGTAGADIHASSAWAIATGSRANVVTVVDTGVDYAHQDLAANMWSAPTTFNVTIGGTTVTCPAGSHGFNAISRTCDPMDDNNHGTHVAGTIGAAGSNAMGVTGVNWTASIMATKFLDSTGTGNTADAINAIEFSIQAKSRFGSAANVRVLSNSWSGAGFSQALLDEINRANANGMLFVAAAGNDGSNNDTTPAYPANFAAANVVAVAATDNTDRLASFSNFGLSVHLAAPGVFILSTTRGNGYQYFSGTSMAAPHVSGAAALVLSRCALGTAALKSAIIGNVDAVAGLAGKVSTGGRLNVDRILRACAPGFVPTVPGSPGALTVG